MTIMSSLVTNLNSFTAQEFKEIVNLATTADGCVHTVDTTQLDFAHSRRQICSDSSRLSPKLRIPYTVLHTADATQFDSQVTSAVCIGLQYYHQEDSVPRSNQVCHSQMDPYPSTHPPLTA